MAPQEALIVPVELAALAVNDEVRKGQAFLRWQMDYDSLPSYGIAEPEPFDAPTDFNTDPSHNGIYLQWTLPAALRRAAADPGQGPARFPLLPNRWLVVRHSGPSGARQATAWVVESDFLDPRAGTSPYLVPSSAGAARATWIGRKTPIGPAGWQEPAAAPLFLTAVAPGLATFAAYQPYNENVFSLHDPLAGVAPADTLSYLVVGWYSDPTRDPLATDDFATRVRELGWQAREQDTATRSIYSGTLHSLAWNADGSPPPSAKPAPADVKLAVGATTIDALTALVTRQAGTDDRIQPELLEAFQYGVLDLLGQPDGEAEVQRRIHDGAFTSAPGGYTWEIVDAPGAGAPPAASELAAEEAWLADLNVAQAAYDKAARELADSRRRLYETWWLAGLAAGLTKPPTGVDVKALEAQLDPTNTRGLAYATAQQASALAALAAKLPSGATQEQLAAAIETFAGQRHLPSTRQLKRVALPSFAQANDPVILLAGTKAQAALTAETELPCRFPDQLVSHLRFEGGIDAARLAGAIPTPNMRNLPPLATALLAELFLLDPANAPVLVRAGLGSEDPAKVTALQSALRTNPATIAQGTLPPFGVGPWAQPWEPLYLLWEIDYYPIAHDVMDTPTWSFDGTDFTWTGAGAATQAMTFKGRTLLTPQAVFNLQAQIVRYERQHPDPDLQAVADFLTKTDGLDLLSQTLDGLGSLLALRDPRTRLVPPAPIAELVGAAGRAAPTPGDSQAHWGKWPPSLFQQLRAGQFVFDRVSVVDRFGQAAEVLNTATSARFAPILAPSLQPQRTVLEQEPQRFVQLPPRLLQGARVRFELISASDDTKLTDQHVDADPLCGWVLPNHLDGSLLIFDPAGAPLGELRVVTDAGGQPTPWWTATPGSAYATVPSLAPDFAHLAAFLEHFTAATAAQGAADLSTLRATIDETLALIEPLGGATDGSLAVLAGRPLALVRASLALELDGPALADPSWRYALTPAVPDFVNYPFPIRLGDLGRLGDGLVGYFTAKDYDRFDAVHVAGPQGTYAFAIAPGNHVELTAGAPEPKYLTLLLDPRAPVHATSEILPLATLAIPPALVRAPLAALAPTFRIGPALTTTDDAPSRPPAIVLPQPALRGGTWSWAELDGTAWRSSPVVAADPVARLPTTPTVRTGMLKLSDAEGAGGSP